jgi:hypothetical protein
MPTYACCFLDQNGHSLAYGDIAAPDARASLVEARRLLETDAYIRNLGAGSVEVWRRAHLVGVWVQGMNIPLSRYSCPSVLSRKSAPLPDAGHRGVVQSWLAAD